MRLFTHNMLQCNAKGVTMGYPLTIEATEVEALETEYNPDFVRNLVPKLDWAALLAAAATLEIAGLPAELTPVRRRTRHFNLRGRFERGGKKKKKGKKGRRKRNS
tara:strand:- start:97 stop:411 length:315 start_codon:yes stop_codon:yes gene_type:complete